MSVPEAPVDEDAGAVFAEYDVGLSRQTFAVDAIAESLTPQPSAHENFRLRILRAYGCHTLRRFVIRLLEGHCLRIGRQDQWLYPVVEEQHYQSGQAAYFSCPRK